jgi:hypothetical protein
LTPTAASSAVRFLEAQLAFEQAREDLRRHDAESVAIFV